MYVTIYDRMYKARKNGRTIVTTFLNAPHEMFLAANAFSTFLRLDLETFNEMALGRSELQKWVDIFGLGQAYCFDLCSSAGGPYEGAFRRYDLVVSDFPAKKPEWNALMDEVVNQGDRSKWNYLQLEIPRGLKHSEALKAITQKLEILRDALEEQTGEEITDEAIREACEKTNRVREHVKKMDELLKADPMPITGSDVFWTYVPLAASYIGGEVDRIEEIFALIVEDLEDLIKQGTSAYGGGAARLLIIPNGNVHRNIYPVLEKNGGAFVADWPCCGHGGLIYRDEIKTTGNPIKALAEHYVNTHGIFDPVRDTKDIMAMITRMDIDGVLYNLLPDKYGYAAIVESLDEIRRTVTENGIPIMVTSQESSEYNDRLNIELKDFIETCKNA